MSSQAIDEQLFRAELDRVLLSPEFSNSRLLQKFLQYVTERALAGATQIDQTEIATSVLGRDSSFNPIEDASVRKLASQVRHRLEQHYARCTDSKLVIALPVRSYVPKLGPNRGPAEIIVNAQESEKRRGPTIFVAAGLVILSVAGAWFWLSRRTPKTFELREITLRTARGDISNRGSDALPTSVMLGAPLAEEDSVMVKMDFTANQEAQQAGLLAWIDNDNYVQLGRRFFGRNQIVFLKEEGGVPLHELKSTTIDPEGQSGRPIWLMIKRSKDTYRGFTSFDGLSWQEAADPIRTPPAFRKSRIGLYAFNGRRAAATVDARFAHLSTGAVFGQQLSDAEDISRQWSRGCTCGDGCRDDLEKLTLRLSFAENQSTCWAELVQSLPNRDWALTTKLDFSVEPGSSAGVGVKGSNGSVRLVRYFLNRPSLAMIYDGKWLEGVPDLNGSPAIYLRLASSKGDITGAYSTDGERYVPLPRRVPVAELGDRVGGGIRMNINSVEGSKRSARFYFLQKDVNRLLPYR